MIGSLYAIGLSMITSHQEDRFLLPTTPALHLLIGFLLSAVLPSARVMLKADVDKYKNKDVDMLACEESSHKTFSMLFLVICLVHLSAIGYLTRLHQVFLLLQPIAV